MVAHAAYMEKGIRVMKVRSRREAALLSLRKIAESHTREPMETTAQKQRAIGRLNHPNSGQSRA